MDSQRDAPAPKVFISYRREDTAGHAGRLFDAIVARFGDHHVFMDVDLAPGVDFANRITEAIGGSDVLLVIIGPRWASVAREGSEPRLSDPRDYVRLEVETALARPDMKVIPVLVAGAQMPGGDEVPDSLQPLRRRNALELSDARWRYDVGRLVRTLEEATGAAVPTPPPQAASPGQPGRTRLFAIVGGLAVVVLVVVLAVAGVFSGSGNGGGSTVTGSAAATGGSTVTPAGAEGAARAYETAYETKDVDGLRKILDPNVVLKKGPGSEWRGVDDVIAEYRREFKDFGNRNPGFDYDVGGSDRREEIDEIHGPYRITANGIPQTRGTFGVLAVIVGSNTSIKELCFDCPDLRHPGGFIAS